MRFSFSEPPVAQALLDEIKTSSIAISEQHDLGPLIERIKDKRVVMLGEASHGTSEYYSWRSAISRKLIEEHGFQFIGVEGDWPPCYEVNRFVKGASEHTSAWQVLEAFRRWPTWMWANNEVLDFVQWLKQHNDKGGWEQGRRGLVGFYGLDMYSLWESTAELMQLLAEDDGEAYAKAKEAMECYQLLAENSRQYNRLSSLIPSGCKKEILSLLTFLRQRPTQQAACDAEREFLIEQNARVVQNAESYYRKMLHVGPESWNIRDRHMSDSLERLLSFHGDEAKCIIWEHNSHIGDARHTDMAAAGMCNLGQLAREKFGQDKVALVGFGSYKGSVIAAEAWDAPMQRMEVPKARRNSWEQLFHEVFHGNALYLSKPEQEHSMRFFQPRGHRAIGVIYRPETEAYSNYVPTVLPLRYDAWIYLDQTEALHPIRLTPQTNTLDTPETFPSAV